MKFKTGDNVKLIINPENEKYFTKHMRGFNKNKIYEVLGNNGSDCIQISNGRRNEMINQDRYELAYKIHPRLIAEVRLHDPLAADYMEDWTGYVRDYNADELCGSIEWADTIQGNTFWNILDSKVGKVDLDSPMPEQVKKRITLPKEYYIRCTTIKQIETIYAEYNHESKIVEQRKILSEGKIVFTRIKNNKRDGWNPNRTAYKNVPIVEYAEWLVSTTNKTVEQIIDNAVNVCGPEYTINLKENEIMASTTTIFVTETNHFINEMNVDSMNEDQFLASIVACEEKIASLKALGTQTKAVKIVIKTQEKCLDNIAKHFDERFGK